MKSSDLWLDSSATIYVCNNKTLFKTYEEQNEHEVILMGNHNSTKILEKEIIDLLFTSR